MKTSTHEPPKRLDRQSFSRLVFFLILALVGTRDAEAQIVLDVQPGASPDQVVLSWAGGTQPYNLYMGGSGDLSGAVETVLAATSNTSQTLVVPGNLVFFRVGDSTAPNATITSPSNGSHVTGGHSVVSGNFSGTPSSVWVNRRQSQLAGSSFTANDVLLVLGDNALHAAAVTGNGNIFISTSQVTRDPGNDPPFISIVSPIDGAEVADVTPLVQLSYSDSPPLDPANLRVYLDGVDETPEFAPTATPTNASWQVPGGSALAIGTHVLRATIRDSAGYTSSASSQFRVSGPRLDSLTPSKGIANTTVTIAGAGFGTTLDTMVFFNGIQATTVLSMTQTQIQVRVPTGATDGPVTVEVNTVPSNPLTFDISFTTGGGASINVAVDMQDRIYYLDQTRMAVMRMNQNGTGLINFFSSFDEIDGISFDPAGTTLYVATRGLPGYIGTYQGSPFQYLTGRIYSVDLSGNSTLRFVLDPFATPRFSDPMGIDVKSPFVYVGAYQVDTAKVVLRLDLNNTGSRTVVMAVPQTEWLMNDVKVDSLGNIYVTDVGAGASPPAYMYKNGSIFYQIGFPFAMTVDCLDRVLFTDSGNNQVLRLTGPQSATLLSSTGSGGPFGIDIDSKGSLFVATNSVVRRATGTNATISSCSTDFAVSLTGDGAKIYADYDPSLGIETPNNQFVVLTACLGDSLIPRASGDLVYWTWEDVDDPSSDPTIDPPTPGGDNLGDLDGSLEFTQEATFTLTVGPPGPFQFGTAYGTVGPSVCSKVRFHFTDAPGDNFMATATLRTKLGDRAVASKAMTVWKRVHVELDSMGDVEGAIDSDDAVIGDVPDPLPDFLAAAFAPAYIEIFNDGPGSITNVNFDPHVPNQLANVPTAVRAREIQDQGRLGRDKGASSTGGWKLYGQGAYEGEVDRDHDSPSTEDALLGITNQPKGKYTLVFAETIRDWVDGILYLDEAYTRRAIALHELAHQFGLDDVLDTSDGTGGIMEYGSNFTFPYFNALQLRMIRTVGLGGHFPSETEVP